METIIFRLNHNKNIMTYCITVDFGTIVLKCKNHLFDKKSLLFS